VLFHLKTKAIVDNNRPVYQIKKNTTLRLTLYILEESWPKEKKGKDIF